MNEMISEIFELEQILSNVHSGDLYEVGLGFFSILGYPIHRKGLSKNVDIHHFVESSAERKVYFNPYERWLLQSVNTISSLFSISYADLYFYKKAPKQNGILNFVAIDYSCYKNDRSFNAFLLTKILSKAFINPTFFLMHHEGCIVLATQLYESPGDEDTGKVYLSEWFNCYHEKHEKLFDLTRFSFFYHSNQSIASLYLDMIYSISRNYFIWQESYEYLFGYYYKPSLSLLFMHERHIRIKDYIDEQKHKNHIEIYGHDYIENEWIRILKPDDEEDIYGEDYKEECSDELNDYDSFEDDNELSDKDFDKLSEDDFNDPLKIISFLEEIELADSENNSNE